jgi:pyrrolidone-carboxylate peptidase
MVLIYAFANRWSTNVSARVLMDLIDIYQTHPSLSFQKIYAHPRSFFNKYITGSHYPLIIGLGDYYGPLNSIRIETVAKNQYGTAPITALSPVTLNLSLPPLPLIPNGFTFGQSMGSYNCNWMAYSIQTYINRHSPSSGQLFFHLPPKISSTHLAALLTDLLDQNHLF